MMLTAIVLLALTSSATPQATPAAAAPTVVMTAEDQSRLGVATSVLSITTTQLGLPAFVRVVDISNLALLDSDLIVAEAASNASEVERSRVETLAHQDQSVSQQTVETARVVATTNSMRVRQLRRRLALEWGSALASMPPMERDNLLNDISAGRAALVRADSLRTPEGVIGLLSIRTGLSTEWIEAQPLGLAATVDPRMLTTGLLCLVRGSRAADFRPGSVYSGTIATGSKVDGILIPRSAIVRIDSRTWAYVRREGDLFERLELVDPQRLEDGWLILSGFTAGDQLVVQGAGALLAAERADEVTEAE